MENGVSNMGQEITVMVAADINYLHPAMVLLTSLFHNHRNQRVTVYFLYIGFTEEIQNDVSHYADQWKDKEICCVEVTQRELGELRGFGRFSVAAYFRVLGMLLLPESIHRILYLDVDMVVNGNLSQLFSMPMKSPVAACYDINNYLQGNIEYHKSYLRIPKEYDYFNSGMLLMDLDYMRKHNIADKLLKDIQEHFEEYSLVDQDALNKCFYQDVQILPWEKYNCPCVPFLTLSEERALSPEKMKREELLTYQKITKEGTSLSAYDVTCKSHQKAVIIHFCTSQKPWRDKKFYQKDNMRDAIRIYQRYERIYQRLKDRDKR